MSNDEKIAMLEEIMDVDEGTLEIDTVLDEIDEWDSLSKLSLIAEAKKTFKIKLTSDVIESFATVKDICDFLK
ncbi:MAG: acyl carrier protein [Schwartzia succinivorans]|jgi:acyl carrier protein|uniref:acyl carrier protein n=1 Tax=Schwartzia succinivorans TaxID=55507 RepID=UPI002355129E|nr:acyl carrier protein [Schwartzia succinivorans]MBE6096541.1 acyl carrier protein [Schwartzia succinivorans]